MVGPQVSYCRVNKTDSDVYVFGSGRYLECYVAWRVAASISVPDTFMVHLDSPNPERKMLSGLLWLKTQGARVPNRAIERLQEEADEREMKASPPPDAIAELVYAMEDREKAAG